MRTRNDWNRRSETDLASTPAEVRGVRNPPVTFRDLTREEIEAVLARHDVGRMAFAMRSHVDIEPIHYVYADGALFGRTTPGTKLTILEHQPWVAFEVDEVDGPFDWRSVVLKGTVYFLQPDQVSHPPNAYDHAVCVIKSVMPQALTRDDPVPDRTILFRVHIDETAGRAATTGRVRKTRTLV